MADLNEPKKETVRITLPPRAPQQPNVRVGKDTARINLPNRPPGPTPADNPLSASASPAPVRPPPPSLAPKPLPPSGGAPANRPPPPPMVRPPAPAPPGAFRPPGAPPLPVGLKPPSPPSVPPPPQPAISPMESRGTRLGPRKETARITGPPDSPMKATVKLSNVQPTSVPTAGVIRTAPLAVANPPLQGLAESVPTQLCWTLLGISALTLLIQLWTYFS